MSKTARIFVMIAVVLAALTLILFTCSMAACGWDFSKLGTGGYIMNTYEPNGAFDKISIRVDTSKITFAPSEDGSCKILCHEKEKVKHAVTVQDGVLVIETIDTRKWYDHIGIFFDYAQVTVYLPQRTYASLRIDTDTGDIRIPEVFSFESVRIDADTGNVTCFAAVSGALEIELSTGDIHVASVATGVMDLATNTGNIKVEGTAVGNDADIETDTGNVTLQNVVVAGSLSVDTDTGNVKLEASDAGMLSISTDTGNVSGTLLSDKVFLTETSSGRVRVPKTTTGGTCEITTATGNIDISIQE